MRKRFAILLAANAQWPDAQTGGIGFFFNWVKIDNKGQGSVDLGLSPMSKQGDKMQAYATITGGKTRIFNLAGPRSPGAIDPDPAEDWLDQVYLFADGTGTTLMLEVSDHPIVDQSQVT